MLESERWLWQRSALWLVLAPVVLTLLVYAAFPWIDASLAEPARTESALGIGFGSAMCFTAIFLLGFVHGQLGDAERADRSAVSSAGMILLTGGVAVRVVGMLVRWIARLVR